MTDAMPVPLMRLRYERDGAKVEIDFATAQDCAAILQALGRFVAGDAPAARPAETPLVASPAEPQPPRPKALLPVDGRPKSDRHRLIEECIARHGMASPSQMMAECPNLFPSGAALSQWLAGQVSRADCSFERVGRGYYRLRSGGVAAESPATFRSADGPDRGAPPDLAAPDPVEVVARPA